jgi:hypothetical protein
MKKVVILVVTGLGLVLLLGAAGPRPQVHDPNSEFHGTPCAQSRGRILGYEIVVADNPKTLAEQVNGRLKDRQNKWIPLGGISVDNSKCHQAMVLVTE